MLEVDNEYKNECKVNYCYEAVILFQEMSEFLTLIHTEIQN